MSEWILQRKEFGIGNFIMTTPAIITMARTLKKRIPVFFETDIVQSMYLDCDFIEILESRPNCSPKFTSDPLSFTSLGHKDPEFGSFPDFQFCNRQVCREFGISFYDTPKEYVDTVEKPKEITFEKYVVVCHGANHNQPKEWVDKKDPGNEIYKQILTKINLPVVFIGDEIDYEQYIKPIEPSCRSEHISIIGDIRKSLGSIDGSTFVVSNDTGVYHAAGALNKLTFVLWKDTAFLKNLSSGENVIYALENFGWIEQFERFLEYIDE